MPPEEVRKSSRLHGGDAQLDHTQDEATQFAMFLIDGAMRACPCGSFESGQSLGLPKQKAYGRTREPMLAAGARQQAHARWRPSSCELHFGAWSRARAG